MGINYYGKCTGVSGGKYDIWMNISQNSQNILSNTSNITVKVYLKRNDGYSASAYNLDSSENNIKITVSGVEKVNKNIAVDTRNNVTVTLAQWTGNVSHNADGSLLVDLGAVFTMNSTNLSGGSVSKSYKCTTIPRASDVEFSATSVAPDSSLKATIVSASSKFTHRLIWSVGDKTASVDIGAGVSEYTMAVPLEWISQVTTSAKGTLKITLKTYNNGVVIGTTNKNIPFVIPKKSEYFPEFNISLERIDNGVPESFNEYVMGISQLKVDLIDSVFKYGASLHSVSITVGDVSKRKNPATFDLIDSGEINVSVSLRDSRGFVTEKSQVINVCDYESPSLKIGSIQRCDSDGTLNSRGKYLVIDYQLGYSSINQKNTCEALLKFKTTRATAFGDAVILTGSPFVFGDGNIEESSSYEVSVGVKDSVSEEYKEFTRSVTVADIPFNIRRGGKGAAFGKFAENDNELGVAWNMSVEGNLNVSGELNFQEVTCETTELSQELICNTRYFPALKMVRVYIRFEATTELSANTTHTVARLICDAPQFFTPLQTLVHFSSGVLSMGGILNTGEIIFRPTETISAGTRIYISGTYII